jgi:hypothetical protein
MSTSILTRHQVKTLGPVPVKGWRQKRGRLEVEIRYDDKCNNGHNTFAITGTMYSSNGRAIGGGCLHDEIVKAFPELKKYIKFHLMSSDGPLHYKANSLYWAEQSNLAAFKSSAIWPEATMDDMRDPNLKEVLAARLPGLLAEFKLAIEELGFIF